MATWSIYKVARKLVWLGFVETSDEREASEKAIIEFKVAAHRLVGNAISGDDPDVGPTNRPECGSPKRSRDVRCFT
jgi:hypothetical protein